MEIGKAIKTLRKQKEFSQDQLSEKTGISISAISQIENGATFPQRENIKKICDAFQIPVAYLMFFSITDEDMPKESRALFQALKEPIENALLKEI